MQKSSTGLRAILFIVLGIGLFALGRFTAPQSSNPEASLSRQSSSKTVTTLPVAGEGVAAKPTLSKKEIEVWRERLSRSPRSEARDEDLILMLAAWAQVDPSAALQYVQKNLSHDLQAQGLSTVFAAWAKKDPSGAWNWVTTNALNQPQHLRSVLSEIGKNNIPLAQEYAGKFAQQHPEQAADVYLCVMDGVMHSGNFQDAIAVVAQARTRDDEQKGMLINFLAGQWARYQPDQAAPWVLSLPPGPIRDQALDAVGQAWSDRDPVGAANFAVTLPPGATRQTALKQAISKWTMDDPAQASRWILQFDAHQDFDQAVASIATSNGLMFQNLNLALNWAGSIQDENLRAQTTTTIVSNWYSNDPAAALNYIKTSPDLSASTRDSLLKLLPPPPQPSPGQKGS